MINRLYIDDCWCFTNFEWRPGVLSLLLGDNGSGKSSLFDFVGIVRDFVNRGTASNEAFPNRLAEQLREVLDGFESMQFQPIGESAKALRFVFDYMGTNGSRSKHAFGPARLKSFEGDANGVSPAEIVARGWEG